MSERRPVGSTTRNWDLPDDGVRALDRCGLDDVANAVWNAADEWPAEIEMANGPNIIVHSQIEHDAIRGLMAQNARLAARNEP